MTLNEYIKGLNDFLEANPNAGDLQVITSSDDEGNSFNIVHYSPSIGNYEDKEFQSAENLKEDEYSDEEIKEMINSVCVN